MPVPNPFSKLCINHWFLFFVRFSWSIFLLSCILLTHWMLEKRKDTIENRQANKLREFRNKEYELEVRLDKIDAIIRARPSLLNEIARIIVEYVDVKKEIDLAHIKLSNTYDRRRQAMVDPLHRIRQVMFVWQILLGVAWVGSLVAIIWQFTLYIVSDDTRSFSGWRDYQSFVIASSYASSWPFTSNLLSHAFLMVEIGDSYSPDFSARAWFRRMLAVILWWLPMIFTHAIPSVTIFIFPIVCLISPVLSFCYIHTGIAARFSDKRENYPNILLLMMIVELLIHTGLSAFIRWTSGEDFFTSISLSFQHGYCNEFFTFQVSRFTWKEWAIVIGWMLG